MRKASQILMRIGAAFAVVTVLSNVLTSIIVGSFGSLYGIGMLIGFFVTASGEYPQYVLLGVGIGYWVGFLIAAAIVLCMSIFPLISAILGFLGGRKKAGKVIFILNIVFAILLAYNFGSGYGLIAAVLLLVGIFLGLSAVKEEKAALEEQPVEEK